MKLFLFLIFFVLGILSLRGARWAYITFVVLGLLYFPASIGFRLDPQPCELTFDMPLAIHSLTNYAQYCAVRIVLPDDERAIPDV